MVTIFESINISICVWCILFGDWWCQDAYAIMLIPVYISCSCHHESWINERATMAFVEPKALPLARNSSPKWGGMLTLTFCFIRIHDSDCPLLRLLQTCFMCFVMNRMDCTWKRVVGNDMAYSSAARRCFTSNFQRVFGTVLANRPYFLRGLSMMDDNDNQVIIPDLRKTFR